MKFHTLGFKHDLPANFRILFSAFCCCDVCGQRRVALLKGADRSVFDKVKMLCVSCVCRVFVVRRSC